MMNNHFKSYLQYKALAHRFSNPLLNGDFLDSAIETFPEQLTTDKNGATVTQVDINENVRLQNVCAKIALNLVRRMEANLEVLGMSKREFIEIAIISALEESEQIMTENDVQIPDYDSHSKGDTE
jgi:hypothetical protein